MNYYRIIFRRLLIVGMDISTSKTATPLRPLYLYTSIPLYLYTSIPLYLYTSIPLYLYTSIPLYRYTAIPLYRLSIGFLGTLWLVEIDFGAKSKTPCTLILTLILFRYHENRVASLVLHFKIILSMLATSLEILLTYFLKMMAQLDYMKLKSNLPLNNLLDEKHQHQRKPHLH